MSKLRNLKLTDVQNQSISYTSSSGSGSDINGGSLPEVIVYGSWSGSGSGSGKSAATCQKCGRSYDSWGLCPNCDYSSGSAIDGGSLDGPTILGSWPGSGSGSIINGGGGGGGGGWNPGGGNNPNPPDPPTPPEPQYTKPAKRNDCSRNAINNASYAKTILNNLSVIRGVDQLRARATLSVEYFTAINYINQKLVIRPVTSGLGSSAKAEFSQATVYAMHTHNGGGGGYTGPSVEDIHTILAANHYFYGELKKDSRNTYNLQGVIIFAYDGSEYFLSIDDRMKAKNFFDISADLFNYNKSNNFFSNQAMYNEFTNIQQKLESEGYSKQDCFDFAMVYMLDKYSTGLKISKRTHKEQDFKEMKTEENNQTYQPKICP